MLFHRIRTTSAVYHFRLPLSTSGSAHVHVSKRLWVLVPQVELNFLLSFLSTCYLSSTSFYLSSNPFCVPVFIQLCLAWNRERVALQLRDNQRLSTSTLLAVLFHRIRTTSAVYHFRLPLSTSGSAHVHVSKRLWVRVSQELNFLLSTCYLSSTSFYLSSTPFCVPVFIQLCLAWNRERVALQLRAPPIDE